MTHATRVTHSTDLRRVVLIGPECTGKTVLASALASWYEAPLSEEYARAYAEAREGALSADDVEPIARGQVGLEDAARAEAVTRGAPLVIHDTDLVSTVVYARYYYGDCPAWVVDAARLRRADLYLFCAPDVPWESDPVRGRAEARDEQVAGFRAALDAVGASVIEIGGDRAARESAARAAVDTLLR